MRPDNDNSCVPAPTPNKLLMGGIVIASYALITLLPTPEGLTPNGQKAIALMAAAVLAWGIRGSAPCRRLHTFHRSARRHGRYAPAQGHGALCHAHPVLSFRHVLYLHRLSEFGPEPASCGLAEHEVRRKCEKASFPHDDGLRSAFDHSCGSAVIAMMMPVALLVLRETDAGRDAACTAEP